MLKSKHHQVTARSLTISCINKIEGIYIYGIWNPYQLTFILIRALVLARCCHHHAMPKILPWSHQTITRGLGWLDKAWNFLLFGEKGLLSSHPSLFPWTYEEPERLLSHTWSGQSLVVIPLTLQYIFRQPSLVSFPRVLSKILERHSVLGHCGSLTW